MGKKSVTIMEVRIINATDTLKWYNWKWIWTKWKRKVDSLELMSYTIQECTGGEIHACN